MLTTILALLSSSGLGSIIGLLGGLLNRRIDIAARKDEYDFELKKMDKQAEYLKLEFETKTAVATIEAEGSIEVAGYNALSESYKFAATSKEDGIVDKLSKAIRPLLTLMFFFLSCYIFYQIHFLVGKMDSIPEQGLFEVWKSIIEWAFFQTGIIIGWWFANRNSKMAVSFGKG